MTANRFDRLRPRTVGVEAEAAQTHDAEGKRALFSSTEQLTGPSTGHIEIECSRCAQVTSLTPMAAVRAAFPAFHTSVTVRRHREERTFGLLRRRYGSWLRCPACGKVSWVRVSIRL